MCLFIFLKIYRHCQKRRARERALQYSHLEEEEVSEAIPANSAAWSANAIQQPVR